MTNHPRQREMWDGLTGTGCLGLICFIIVLGVAVEYLNG